MTADEAIGLLTVSFHHHERWRTVGTIILLVGIIAELLVGEFWEADHPPLLRGRKATQFIKPISHRLKRLVLIVVGIGIVGTGITMDWLYGNLADDDSENISRIQQARIADAESEQAIFERLVSPRQILFNGDLRKLKEFAGTQYWVQTVSFPLSGNMDRQTVDNIEEAQQFAGSFSILGPCCSWIPHPLSTQAMIGSDAAGVTIYSRRADPYQPWMKSRAHWRDPYAMPLDTPARKSWAAAEALEQYLESDLNFSMVLHLVTDDIRGNLKPEFAAFSESAVIIRIGAQTSREDLANHVTNREFEMMR